MALRTGLENLQWAIHGVKAGGHFVPHKDTPRGQNMFGTLVVFLPSQFWRGDFVLAHRGVVQRFDWGSAIGKQTKPNQLHWAAFFGDVDHQIKEVFGGARVTLTYLLRRGEYVPTPRVADKELAPAILHAWCALLADPKFLPEGGIVGYPCCHLYHQDARFQAKSVLKSSRCCPIGNEPQLISELLGE